MLPDNERSRPQQSGFPKQDSLSLAEGAAYALVVLAGMANGGTRRRAYFNLPSAQRAVERCHARGLAASLHLVRLVPVPWSDVASVDLEGPSDEP